MTYDEILTMTPAELREAIAKLVEPTITYSLFDVPNWPENISDAMKLEEEVSHTTLKDRERYIHMLEYVVRHHPDTCYVESEIEGWFKIDPFYLIHATAEQRCRAWLMWKEAK